MPIVFFYFIGTVTGGFSISASTATRGIADNKTWQVSEDLTFVRGRHQVGPGRQRPAGRR